MNAWKLPDHNPKFILVPLLVLLCHWPLESHPSEFELTTLDNRPTRLTQHLGHGKWVLVMLWASDCTICMQQEPSISAFHDAHKSHDAIVIGVSIDGPKKLAAINDYLNKFKPSFDTLVGELETIAAAYQSVTAESFRGTPTYLLYTPKGKLVGNNPGLLKTSAIEQFIKNHPE